MSCIIHACVGRTRKWNGANRCFDFDPRKWAGKVITRW